MAEFDKFGIPFFHRSKNGGYFYQMSSNPKNDKNVDWPDEMSFGTDKVTMKPSGPTDFGVGKNIEAFMNGDGSIDGCGMDFKKTAARGYAFKKDDARDIEFKAIMDFDGISKGNGFSVSACTGRHSGDGCCQGFAYMGTMEVTESPCSFRFRKEIWHVQYDDSPEGDFTHSKFNFKVDGHGRVGYGFCRYNKRKDKTKDSGDDDQVILEIWGNPDPDADIKNWTMLKRITDQKGNGWSSDGGDCGGDDDQVGTWSNAQNRMKTNSSGGTVVFTAVSLREIDEFNYYGDTPSGGGGGGQATPLVYTYERKFGTDGTGNGQFKDPHDISFDATGNIFVCDRVRNDVQKFTNGGTYISKFGGSGTGNGQFNVPYAIQHTPDFQFIYVMDRDSNRIQKLDANGVYVTKMTAAGGKNFNSPEDIVFNKTNGDFYVCDTGNNRILKFDKDHNFIRQWGSKGSGNGQFDHPHSMDLGPDGNVYISSGNQGYIQVFSPDGAFLRKFGSPGSGEGQLLTFLEHMSIDKFGRLHIVNNNVRPIVSVFDCLTGAYITKYGSPESEGSANGQFREAEHVTCYYADGKPYVVDAKNQRIQVFSFSGGVTPAPPSGPPPPPPSGSSTLKKTFRDFFNINTSPAQSCSGISAGVLPFVVKYTESAGLQERKIQDIATQSNRTRIAELCVSSSSSLFGIKPRRFTIPMKKTGSPGGNVKCAIWDDATSPEGGNEVIVLGTASVSSALTEAYQNVTFYNEVAPLSLPQGLKAGWRIGVEYLGTSDVDWITVKFNNDVVNGGNSIYSAYQMTAPDPKKWTDFATRDLTCIIEE